MAGTYFYHSHVGIQAMSATGPLNVRSLIPPQISRPWNMIQCAVVESPLRSSSPDMYQVVEADHPPYHYDGERIIFIQDVYRVNDSYLEQGLAHRPIIYDGDQTMVLINGRGAGITNYGDFCNETLSVINVQPGKTYRLRLIGGMTQSFDSLAIEGHDNLEVIEADAYVSSFIFELAPLPPTSSYCFSNAKTKTTNNKKDLHKETQHLLHANRCRSTLQCSSSH